MPRFLDREVEAQLKLDRLPRRVQLDRGFPRPRGRGPIEAPRVTCSRSARAWFPRPRGRGPIEATFRGKGSTSRSKFPRPRGRGPIEASRWMERPGAPQPRFLDREVEAQLKRGRGDPLRLPVRGFLDREVEAQLKLYLGEL